MVLNSQYLFSKQMSDRKVILTQKINQVENKSIVVHQLKRGRKKLRRRKNRSIDYYMLYIEASLDR